MLTHTHSGMPEFKPPKPRFTFLTNFITTVLLLAVVLAVLLF